MSVTHDSDIQNALTDLTVDRLDIGAGSNATLELQDSGGTALATLAFSSTAFGDAGAVQVGLATANPITPEASATAGTIAGAAMLNKDGVEKIWCDVGVSGSDINISTLNLQNGDQVTMSTLTYKGSL